MITEQERLRNIFRCLIEGYNINELKQGIEVLRKEFIPKKTMITDKQFIKEENKDEILSIIESFLNHLKPQDWARFSEGNEYFWIVQNIG